MYAFFPKLALNPQRTTTFLTDEQQRRWLNGVFLPALYAAHNGEDGLLQHFPASYESAKAAALAQGTEQLARDHEFHLSREQLIQHFIQPEKLSGIWDRVLATVEDDSDYAEFKGVALFAAAKKLKSQFMSPSLQTTCSKWQRQYTYAIDAQFHTRSQAFIDLGKQVTAQGSYLAPAVNLDGIPAGHEPQTFLYKRCCLQSFAQWFCKHSLEREGRASQGPDNKPIIHIYSVATTRDAANMTLHFPIGSQEHTGGHYYKQLYSEVQAPFNAAKVYPFENKAHEDLAIDPALAEAIGYAGKATVFDAKTCKRSYLASKNRVH